MNYCFAIRKISRLLLQLRTQTIRINQSHIPNIVNEHFASVGSKLAYKIPSSQQHYLDFVNKNMFPMPSFFFQPLTYDCVKTEILSLPNNKSHGLYSSPTKLLKRSIDIIAPVLSEVFNISIGVGRYPTKLKLSKIVPVFNCDDETDPNNYRPISSLSNFNRIFERLMNTRMMNYIEKQFNLLFPVRLSHGTCYSTCYIRHC